MKKVLFITLATLIATSCIHISPERNVARIFGHFDVANGYEPVAFDTFDNENLAISLAADARVDDIWTVDYYGNESLIGQINGKNSPEKIILISADINDEATCSAAIEILKAYRDLKIKPNYSLRIAFYNDDISVVSNYIKEHDESILFDFQLDSNAIFGEKVFRINENTYFFEKINEVVPPYLEPYGEYSMSYGVEWDMTWPLHAPLYRFHIRNGAEREKDLAAATAFVFLMD